MAWSKNNRRFGVILEQKIKFNFKNIFLAALLELMRP